MEAITEIEGWLHYSSPLPCLSLTGQELAVPLGPLSPVSTLFGCPWPWTPCLAAGPPLSVCVRLWEGTFLCILLPGVW